MAIKYWNLANAGGNFNTASNWNPSGVPVVGDDVFVTGSITAYRNIVYNTASAISSLNFANQASQSFAWSVGGTNNTTLSTVSWAYPSGAYIFVDASSSTAFVDSRPTVTIALSSSIPLRKTGPGVLNFSAGGNNSWTGGLLIETGSINFWNASNVFGTGPITLLSGTAFGGFTSVTTSQGNNINVNGPAVIYNSGSAAQTLTGSINVNNTALTIGTTGAALTLNGALLGSGSITKVGTIDSSRARRLNLGAASTYSGSLIINEGYVEANIANYPNIRVVVNSGSVNDTNIAFTSNTGNSGSQIYSGDSSVTFIGNNNVASTYRFPAGSLSGLVGTLNASVLPRVPYNTGFAAKSGLELYADATGGNAQRYNFANFAEFPNVLSTRIYANSSTILGNIYMQYTGSAGTYPTRWDIINTEAGAMTYIASTTTTLEANQSTGALILSGGISRVGFTTANTQTITLGGTNTADNTIAGAITDPAGPLAITKTGTGKWILNTANTFSGGLTLSAGTLQLKHNSSSLNSILSLNGGTFLIDSSVTNLAVRGLQGSVDFSLPTGSKLTLGDNNDTDITYSGGISGSNIEIIKDGAFRYSNTAGYVAGGASRFTGVSNASGIIRVKDGFMSDGTWPTAGAGNRFPNITSVILEKDTSYFEIYSSTGYALNKTFSGLGAVSIKGNATNSSVGAFSFPAGSLTNLTGTTEPSGWAYNAYMPRSGLEMYTDGTAANAIRYLNAYLADLPSLLIYSPYANVNNIFPYTYAQYTGSAATYPTKIILNSINGAAQTYIASTTNIFEANQVGGALILSGGIQRSGQATANTFNFTLGGTNTADNIIAGAISDPAGPLAINKSGSGKWIFNQANTYSGDTRIVVGTLEIQNSLALQSSSVNLATGDTGLLTFKNISSASLGGLFGARNLALTNSAGQDLATLTFGGDNASLSYTGVLSGSTTDLVKAGTGTQTLANNQLFRSVASVVGGLTVAADSALGTNTSASLILSGGTLTNSNTAFSTNRNITLVTGTSNAINGNITINNAIVGGGNLSHTTGDLILSGANNIGAITVAGSSQISVANANALSGSENIALTGDLAKLYFNQDTTFNRNIAMTAGVGTYIVSRENTNLTYNGSITGGASNAATDYLVFDNKNGIVTLNSVGSYISTVWLRPGINTSYASQTNTKGNTILRDTTANATGFGTYGVGVSGGSVFEMSASSFTKTLGLNGFAIGNTPTDLVPAGDVAKGTGFSSINPSGTTITMPITFQAQNGSARGSWLGPLLMGTAKGTSTGKLTFTGAMDLNGITQEFYVFNGATASGSIAEISSVITGSTTAGILNKAGPGKLILSAKNTYIGATNVSDGILEVKYIGLQYGSGSSTVGGTISANTGSTYRYVGSGSQTYATLDLSSGSNALLIDSAAGAYFATMSLGPNTVLTGAAGQNVICEVGALTFNDMNLSGSNSWKISGVNASRTANTTALSGSKLIISREDNAATLGSGTTTIGAGATLETVTGEQQSGKATYKGSLTLGTAGSGAVKAKYKIGNGPVKDAGATIINGNLVFTAATNLQLNNATIFNSPGEYIIFKYTGACTGFEFLNPTTNIAGRLVSHMRHDPTLKRIYVTLS